MASAAAGAGNESAIDLRPYGINLTLTEELTHSEYDRAVRAVEGTKTRYVVNDEKPDVLFFISNHTSYLVKWCKDSSIFIQGSFKDKCNSFSWNNTFQSTCCCNST